MNKIVSSLTSHISSRPDPSGIHVALSFANWSGEFTLPTNIQASVLGLVRSAHRWTGRAQGAVERLMLPRQPDVSDEISRMQDEGGNAASGTAPYLKRA